MFLQNKIILGTAQTDKNYGFVKNNDLSSLVSIIKKKKFTLDTAPIYKNIDSFFSYFKEFKLNIISKLPSIECKLDSFENLLNEKIRLVFKKVNNRNLDSILIHDPLLPLDKERWNITYNHLINLKKLKKIKNIGVSVYTTYELDKILHIFKPDIVQFPLNVFNQNFLKNDYLKKLKSKHNIKFHARSVFLQGLLLQERSKIPKYFRAWTEAFDKWYKYLLVNKLSPLEACAIFINNTKFIDKFVLGFDNLKQLNQFLNIKRSLKEKKLEFKNLAINDDNLLDPRFWPRNKNKTLDDAQKKWIQAKIIIHSGNMLLSKKPERFLKGGWPTYYSKARGCHVWDLDNKKYLDFSLMGIGTNILGYSNKIINKAVHKAVNDSNVSTLNSYDEVNLGKKLISIHPWAQKTFFAKTGGEANLIALRIARAFSKRNKVAVCGYHGWHDWYLSCNLKNKSNLNKIHLSGLSTDGIPKELEGKTIPFEYNNISMFKNIIKKNPEIGAVIMEVQRNVKPNKIFLKEVRRITKEKKIVLIFDECTSGFRETFGGLHKKYNINPDICVFGKAIGNGIPITAIIGKAEIINSARNSFISSTFWTDKIGFVAALNTISEMQRIKSWIIVKRLGIKIKKFWLKVSKKYKLTILIKGLDSMPSFEFISNKNDYFISYITQEMLKKNILATNTIYCSVSHVKYFKLYAREFEKIFKKLSYISTEKNILNYTKYPLFDKNFQRLN